MQQPHSFRTDLQTFAAQLLDEGPPLGILIKSPLSHRCKSVDNTADFEESLSQKKKPSYINLNSNRSAVGQATSEIDPVRADRLQMLQMLFSKLVLVDGMNHPLQMLTQRS